MAVFQKPFAAISAIVVAASTANANGDFGANLPTDTEACDIYNSTNGIAFVVFSNVINPTATITPNAQAYVIPPGARRIVDKGQARYCGVILFTGATSGNVYLTAGQGGI